MIRELIDRMKKCPEYSCSRCTLYHTPNCAINEAARELERFDQVIKVLEKDDTYEN